MSPKILYYLLKIIVFRVPRIYDYLILTIVVSTIFGLSVCLLEVTRWQLLFGLKLQESCFF